MTALFDRAQIARQRARFAKGRRGADFLFDWTVRELSERLSLIRRNFPAAVRIGSRGIPFQTDKLGIQHLTVTDGHAALSLNPFHFVVAEEDVWPFKTAALDLILGALTLHTINDLPGALVQMRRSLKPDGLFHVAMLGGETLHELRHCLQEAELQISGGVSPRVAPFADMKQMGELMQRAGFALPVVDSEKITVTYSSLFGLMHDLRHMGEGNAVMARMKTFSRKTIFKRADEIYRDRFSEPDGKIRATFEIIFLLGWSPHDSQQKPLRPGSAKARLADALGVPEAKGGEKG